MKGIEVDVNVGTRGSCQRFGVADENCGYGAKRQGIEWLEKKHTLWLVTSSKGFIVASEQLNNASNFIGARLS